MEQNGPRRRPVKPTSIDGFVRKPIVKRAPSKYHLAQTGAQAPQMDSVRNGLLPHEAPPKVTSPVPEQHSGVTFGATLPNSFDQTAPGPIQNSKASARPGKKQKKIRKKWSKKRIALFASIFVILIGASAVAWDAWQLDHKVNHLSVSGLTTVAAGAPENILVAGSTNRCNLKVQNNQWGFCSQGVTGVNSDIIFIVHVVPATKTMSILSIPRDTFVPNARSGDEAFKIDAALYEGPTQLVNAIQEDFGIPINHYAEVGFDGFVNIVNAVNGIKMDFPEPVYDSESYLNIKTAGCYQLDGVHALQVVRARHLQYDPPGLSTSNHNLWPQEVESDIARISRTHEFLRVLGSKVASEGLGNPITDQKMVDAIAPQVQVDSGLTTSGMLQLAEEFHAVNIDNVPQYTLPVSDTNFGAYVYAGEGFGDVTFPSEPSDQQVINQFLGVSNANDTITGKQLPSPGSVDVNVVNGSGTPDQGAQVTSALQTLGFNMVGEPGTTPVLSDEALETVVAYAGPSTEADAETVARQLTGPVILSDNASLVKPGSTVTVITGSALSVNNPTSSSSNSSQSTSSSTSSTTTQAASASSSSTSSSADTAVGLDPANSAQQALSAWDPRACTAGQPSQVDNS